MSDVITVDGATFRQEVIDAEIPVLVDYWAPWCGPCRAAEPIVEELAGETTGWLKVAKVNVDYEPELARSAGVQSIPFLVLYRDGEPIARVAGVRSKGALQESLGLWPPVNDAPAVA